MDPIVWIILIAVVSVFIVTTGLGAATLNGIRVIAVTLKACVLVPWAVLWIAAGATIAYGSFNIIGCVIGGVFLYVGASYLSAAFKIDR